MGSENNMVAVQQCDRETAALVMDARYGVGHWHAQEIREGKRDGDYIVKAKAFDRLASAQPDAQQGEPFGYWIEQKYAEPALLRKPAYIPEPSDLRTVTPLYTATPPSPALDAATIERCAQVFRESVVAQATRLGISPNPGEAPSHWSERVRAAAIRALPNAEKRHG